MNFFEMNQAYFGPNLFSLMMVWQRFEDFVIGISSVEVEGFARRGRGCEF